MRSLMAGRRMMPNLSGRNRAVRLVTSAAVVFIGAAWWPDALDLFCLIGVTTFMTALIGWCPLLEPAPVGNDIPLVNGREMD
jgi:hypothetical protein